MIDLFSFLVGWVSALIGALGYFMWQYFRKKKLPTPVPDGEMW